MNILEHIKQQPFVIASGAAALIHSTWALCTLSAGVEPTTQFGAQWFAWVLPGFLVAFALDVGQIATSADIIGGQRSRAKLCTFFVFAAATYFLQWLYIAHHMPAVDLAAGVRVAWLPVAGFIRDASLWVLPLFMPLSTLLYTFSRGVPEHAQGPRIAAAAFPDRADRADLVPNVPQLPISNSAGDDLFLPDPLCDPLFLPEAADLELSAVGAKPYHFDCPNCDFLNDYATESGRANGKRAHGRHCAGVVASVPQAVINAG